jgi:nucleotide-binding universal stress UspA family protein
LTYRKILVPHDGSKIADSAFEHALAIAKAFNAKLILLTVITENILPTVGVSTASPQLVKGVISELIAFAKKEAHDKLEKKVTMGAKEGVDVSHVVAMGNASETIIDMAKKEGIDLIVIGSRGLTGMKKIRVLGSVTRNVSEHVTCPVLIVH